MRICILTGPFHPLPPEGFGAVENIWLDIARKMATYGNEITMISCGNESGIEYLDGVTHLYLKRKYRSGNIFLDLLRDFAYSLRAMRNIPSCDIIMINMFWLPVFVSLRKPKKYLICYNLARFPKGQLRLYRRIDHVFTVSTAIYEAIRDQYSPLLDRTTVVPNPIRTDLFTTSNFGSKRMDGMVLGYTGRIHPEKGIHVLIRAFLSLQNEYPYLKLEIVGPIRVDEGGGGDVYLNELRKYAGNSKNIKFLPPIRDSQKLALYLRSLDYYCYPSLADKGESFGVAPLEAMGAGLAPIVSDLACFKDFIKGGYNGFIFDHKVKYPELNLARCIRKVLSSSEYLHACHRAYETSRLYSIESITILYLERFRSLIDKHNYV